MKCTKKYRQREGANRLHAQVPNVGVAIRVKPVAEDVSGPQFGAEMKDSTMSFVALVSPQLGARVGSTTPEPTYFVASNAVE